MMIQTAVLNAVTALVTAWKLSKRLTKPDGYWDRILAVESDAKTVKGEKYGFLTGILYLAPSNLSGVINTCTCASIGCIKACLFTAGRAAFCPKIRNARIAKTVYMVTHQFAFLASIAHDIESLKRRAAKHGLFPAVRINGTSDLPWLGQLFARLFPEVQFYDYTKIPPPWKRELRNYHLTFSHSETNHEACIQALKHGISVAVVFGLKKGTPLPETWNGYPVVSGDDTDLRFKDPRGVVIGLYAKGQAKQDTTGFVERPNLITITQLTKVA